MATAATNSALSDEQLCNNCGKCCYKKIIVGRTVFITPFPCEFLDTKTNLCTIYDRRHELNPLCLSIADGMKVSAFPEDCPYVEKQAPRNYRPARDNWDWKNEWSGFDDLADDLDVSAETREKVRARGPDAPPMYVEAYARIQAQREAAGTSGMIWGKAPAAVVNMAHGGEESAAGQTPRLAELAKGKGAKRRSETLEKVRQVLESGAREGHSR
ncbi:MAG TPA: hypothetical protein VEK08_00630 [Planctomycetota bacterium]|nr:hypothetical protein [Planctomycetota bacterium]